MSEKRIKRLERLVADLQDELDDGSNNIIVSAPIGSSGTTPTAINSIDLFDTGNPNELGVQIQWTDSTGATRTTIDTTPITTRSVPETFRYTGGETTTTVATTIASPAQVLVYRSGDLVISPEDYSLAGQVITWVTPMNPGEHVTVIQ